MENVGAKSNREKRNEDLSYIFSIVTCAILRDHSKFLLDIFETALL